MIRIVKAGDRRIGKFNARPAFPDEAEACRIGDERFLVRPAGVHVEDPSFERK